jgi:hypothetical protein
MRWIGGHLGAEVSALVDGQLQSEQAERAWEHVLRCTHCRTAVERETWVKNQVSLVGQCDPPPARLSAGVLPLPDLALRRGADDRDDVATAWTVVGELERRHRVRRGGLLAAGAGTVSAAVIGIAAASGVVGVAEPRPTETRIGGVPSRAPVTAPVDSRQMAPTARPARERR